MSKPRVLSPSFIVSTLYSKSRRPLESEVRRTGKPASVYHIQLMWPWTTYSVSLSTSVSSEEAQLPPLVSRILRTLSCSACFLHQRVRLSLHFIFDDSRHLFLALISGFLGVALGSGHSTGHFPSCGTFLGVSRVRYLLLLILSCSWRTNRALVWRPERHITSISVLGTCFPTCQEG